MTEVNSTDPREPGKGATSDAGWHGDAGDQGNDLRFGEEQQLIEEQSQGNFPAGGQEEPDTSGGYTSHQERGHPGHYTDRDKPRAEGADGEDGDSHGYTSHQEREHPGQYTDSDEQNVNLDKDVASPSAGRDDKRPDSQERLPDGRDR